MSEIGFLGLGAMGGRMARRLLEAGHAVSAYDPVDSALHAVSAAGGRAAGSAADAVRTADFVLASLPSPAADLDVMLGAGGVVQAAPPGAVIVDLGTVGPPTVRRIAAAAEERGVEFLDAPVSGGPAGAARGTLSVMAGGGPAVLDRCRPVLAVLASTVFHVGPVGAGQLMKLCNNLAAATGIAAVSEALAIGERGGLDRAQMLEVLGRSSGASWALDHIVRPALTDPEAPFLFRTSAMRKDVALLVEAAASAGAEAPLGAALARLFSAAEEAGFGERDVARLLDYYAR